MRKIRMLSVLTLALGGLVGCGGDSGSDLVRTLLNESDREAEFACECFYTEFEYASEAECLTDNLLTNTEKQCLVDAFGPVADLNPRQVRCQLDVLRDGQRCYEQYGCAITEAQVDACDAANDPEVICGDDDICYGLTGPDLAECEAEAARGEAAAEACFPG